MKNSENANFYWRIAGTVGITIFLLLLVILFGFTFKILLFILTGILLAGLFRGIAGWVSRKTGLSMSWSLGLSVAGTIALVILINLLLAPIVQHQMQQLADKLPSSIENARQSLQHSWWGQRILEKLPDDPQKFISEHTAWAQQSFGLLSSTFGILADLYVILIIGIFLMINPLPYVNGVVSLVPGSAQERTRQIVTKVYSTLQYWLVGKLLSMLVVAVLTFLGLLILGVPLPLTLALIAGTLAFIPNFGPIFSLIPAVAVGIIESPTTALYIVFLYAFVQFLESNFITPFIQREMVELPLAIIIIAQVMLGMLVGGLGLILATPIVAIGLVLVRMIYIEDILGQEPVGDQGNHNSLFP